MEEFGTFDITLYGSASASPDPLEMIFAEFLGVSPFFIDGTAFPQCSDTVRSITDNDGISGTYNETIRLEAEDFAWTCDIPVTIEVVPL